MYLFVKKKWSCLLWQREAGYGVSISRALYQFCFFVLLLFFNYLCVVVFAKFCFPCSFIRWLGLRTSPRFRLPPHSRSQLSRWALGSVATEFFSDFTCKHPYELWHVRNWSSSGLPGHVVHVCFSYLFFCIGYVFLFDFLNQSVCWPRALKAASTKLSFSTATCHMPHATHHKSPTLCSICQLFDFNAHCCAFFAKLSSVFREYVWMCMGVCATRVSLVQ